VIGQLFSVLPLTVKVIASQKTVKQAVNKESTGIWIAIHLNQLVLSVRPLVCLSYRSFVGSFVSPSITFHVGFSVRSFISSIPTLQESIFWFPYFNLISQGKKRIYIHCELLKRRWIFKIKLSWKCQILSPRKGIKS